ncbi:hypothetical protein SERLA73DRAFT_179740 [Serpula lacrymans var. lacrymans S7.3]|uniref:Uncharacterized protein n=1 Tax=Serpula lacrymans var. lacrymans (strain S7.3) TaxID=936435 RepID=F8PU06_SERL3|nr:hypothetical protein SERLA73DRAFT_179740 [Serpula lacrymans var. lacrymans S7.3]
MSVSVEYHSPSITEEAWRAMLREEDVNEAMEQGWSPNDIERVGRAWTGEGAEAYAKLFVSREDGNISKTAKDRPGKLRDIPKLQPGLPPISTSDSGDICQPLTPSQSLASISRSPEMPYTPLTPASSEISNSSSSGSPNLDLSVDGTCEDEYYTIHKRSPSEPCRTPGEAVSGRNRTATGTMYKGTISESSSGSDEAHTRNRLPGTEAEVGATNIRIAFQDLVYPVAVAAGAGVGDRRFHPRDLEPTSPSQLASPEGNSLQGTQSLF